MIVVVAMVVVGLCCDHGGQVAHHTSHHITAHLITPHHTSPHYTKAFVKSLDPRITAVRIEGDGIVGFPMSLFSAQKVWCAVFVAVVCVGEACYRLVGTSLSQKQTKHLTHTHTHTHTHTTIPVRPSSGRTTTRSSCASTTNG